jgi:inosose dehydratase
MSSNKANRDWSRRDVLATGLATAGLWAGSRLTDAEVEMIGIREPGGAYGPFKMGLQSYSLRGYTSGGRADLKTALSITKQLGLHYWESYPAHLPVSDDWVKIKAAKEEIEGQDIHVIGYGVVPLGKDKDASRKLFQFAKALGVEYLSADPDPDCFDLLDKLVEEYGIAVGIHNHGPGHRYAKIDTIAQAIKDHHHKIGCCIDTGHFLRSREDPVRAVEVFGNRVYGVHLKDVKNADTFTVLGAGDLRTVELLKALAANKYGYCLALEYEEKPANPIEDIKACLAEVRKAIANIDPV